MEKLDYHGTWENKCLLGSSPESHQFYANEVEREEIYRHPSV